MEGLSEFSQSVLGQIVAPTAPDYDQVRRVHNGLIDHRPALIVRCRGVADIADAVRFARARNLEISVRGGGHNVGGRAVADGALMIDLSLMRSVQVNPAAGVATVEGGALWKEVNRETQLHGLAVTGGVVGTTGVAGLTLGGGIGWLMAKHGLALDNLIAVTLVLADGRVVRASAESEPDLFWAARGGGGNFGVAASFEFRLHPVGPIVIGGLVAFPFAEAGKVLRAWREIAAASPDELATVAALTTPPDGSGVRIVGIAACHCGPAEAAQAAAAQIRSLGTVVMDALGPIPYSVLNGILDGGFPPGAHHYWKSALLPALSDDAIAAAISAYERCPAPTASILMEHLHGAACRVPVDATACTLRTPGFNTLVLGQWLQPGLGGATTAWVRETFAALQPFVGPRRYLNYLGPDEEAGSLAAAAYGPNLARLRRLKRQYDPDNVFHLNVNILPE
jgi:FAD/FMN-containing dehydrogenase